MELNRWTKSKLIPTVSILNVQLGRRPLLRPGLFQTLQKMKKRNEGLRLKWCYHRRTVAGSLYNRGSGSWLALTVVPWRKLVAAHTRVNGLLGPQYAASRHTTPKSTTLGLHPVIHVTNYMDHVSSSAHLRPLRDGWLSWPCWLTDSGRLNHKVVTHPANSLAQHRESSPVETSVVTTMLRRRIYIQHWNT